MTIISTHKRVSSREQFCKAVHAKARKDALRPREALGTFERFPYERCRCSYCVPDTPRQRYFRRSWELAEDTAEPGAEDMYDMKAGNIFGAQDRLSFGNDTDTIVSLVDIARPVKDKRKRKAKEAATHYSVASKLHHDALPSSGLEEEFELWEDDVYDHAMWSANDESDEDEWEHIESESKVTSLPSYASVVRRNVES